MIERKASTLRSDHKNIFQPDPVNDGNAMTHGVGLVVGKGPGLPKVLIFPYLEKSGDLWRTPIETSLMDNNML
ncbi:hypothetical protein HYE67_009305 [Fusarium culmorum]|uniref:Uncharacterized protein n=1 Tax=Fusarium culmorum TaxID=5516 RepID=A0A2T4H7V9_FUSCU|nr:hypothetical protein FCULG_00004031 [Fusarium culmorum]QPC67074.1 hypothetical protein HYE67_009305 [Fusarium culmorum]